MALWSLASWRLFLGKIPIECLSLQDIRLDNLAEKKVNEKRIKKVLNKELNEKLVSFVIILKIF